MSHTRGPLLLLSALLAWLLAAATVAHAQEPLRTYLNGRELQLSTAPVIEQGRVLVPARAYLEAMGARVDWQPGGVIDVWLAAHSVRLRVGNQEASVDGANAWLDVPPQIVDGRTLVPLRFLSQALGAAVHYDAGTHSVHVRYQVAPSRGQSRSDGPSGGSPGGEGGTAAEAASRHLEVHDGPLNVRSGGGLQFEVITTVPTGTLLELLADGGEWAQVRLADGRTGWVARAYAREVTPGSSPGGTVAAILAEARRLLGSRYTWGGASPASGFDCSGFLRYVFGRVGLELPRDTWGQAAAGRAVAGELEPGDIVVYTTYAPGPTHTGIYLGEGRFIHAANEETGVTITEMGHAYWSTRYLGARRINY